MKVLHIGSGVRPMRRGGLVAYVEDLMAEQVRRGHDVGYLFSGRYFPHVNGPRLKRRSRDGVDLFEIVDSPLHDHGRQPALEVREPRVERMVEQVIDQVSPDVVHVQELAGLPFSVLDVARRAGVPVVMTLQDYFPLCPTFKLLDSQGQVCLRPLIGADCVATVAADERDPALLYHATVHNAVRPYAGERASRRVANRLTRGVRRRPPDPQTAVAYQRRRDTTVERLNRVDCLIAMSARVAQIYSQLGVDPGRLRTMQLTLEHIEHLRPRRFHPTGPITFATLGGGESEAKGARILLDAARALDRPPESFRLLLFGHVRPDLAREAESIPGVEVRPAFAPDQLDSILDGVDVGIMPSVWEEAYGYAGVEFLAKGIPVIGNAIGGIPDYVSDGETGWLNHSCSADGLARVMRNAIDHPEHVQELNRKLQAGRETIVLPISRHGDEMDEIYRYVRPAPTA